jgi:hypothetical protein
MCISFTAPHLHAYYVISINCVNISEQNYQSIWIVLVYCSHHAGHMSGQWDHAENHILKRKVCMKMKHAPESGARGVRRPWLRLVAATCLYSHCMSSRPAQSSYIDLSSNLGVLLKCVDLFQFWLNSYHNNTNFMCRPHVFLHSWCNLPNIYHREKYFEHNLWRKRHFIHSTFLL